MFKALLLTEKDGKVSSQITQLDEERLPDGDVTVRVQYSTLNYKDGLILNGLGRLARGRGAVGRLCRAGAGQGRLAGEAAGRSDRAQRDGDRDRRFHRHAVR